MGGEMAALRFMREKKGTLKVRLYFHFSESSVLSFVQKTPPHASGRARKRKQMFSLNKFLKILQSLKRYFTDITSGAVCRVKGETNG